ncbi:uncharacterized protein LOC131858250 [Cryptomeria japonica]|uniref:uncharacterized protein LOC131858250 n=1 Tax=Cryptomeria japonica TaxID=3369 RepID=UPI0027D9FB17|nr:uncharacterized protein LOC131858250 [Cryptomeria japonica]
MTEHRCLWESSKAELEGTVAGLENELNETRLKHDEYCIHLRHEKEHLEEKLKGYDYKNNESENSSFWITCKADLEETIAELQNELNESRILCQKNQVSCNVISKENIELENKLKESVNEAKELKEKMAEDGYLWEICQGELENKVAISENDVKEAIMLSQKHEKLWSQSKQEKNEFENRVKQCNHMIEELEGKMNEDRSLWDACKTDMQGEIVKLQDRLDFAVNESNVLEQRYEELEYKLKGFHYKSKELQNELIKKKLLCQNHEKKCTVVRKEKRSLQKKLKECDERIRELNVKFGLSDNCKENLKCKVRGLLDENRIMSQEHDELCNHLTDEKYMLEHKLNECNDRKNKLHAKMNECNDNKSSKADFNISVKISVTRRNGQKTPTKVNASDDRGDEMSESHEKLCTQLTQEKNELENKLKELENKFKECNEEIKELQYLKNELNQTSILSENHEILCTELAQEKYELENKLKECNDEIQRLQMADMHTEIVKLKNKLDSAVNEKNVLNKKHEELCAKHRNDKNELRKCNEGAKKLKVKMVEDQKFWDSSRVSLEGKITEQQNEIDEARKLSKKHEELCTELMKEKIKMEKKIWKKVAQLQDELNETRNLWQKHENLSTELRQENIELGNKLKESNDESKKLKEKLIEDRCLWNLSKAELEGTVVGLQNELNETRLKHEEFCIQLTDEKKHLEEKSKEFDDETKELKAKMTEHRCLWESSKAELEGTVAGLQNELNETRLKHDEYYIHLGHEKEHLEEKLKGYEYKNKELHLKMTENPLFGILKEKIELENKLKESVNEAKELKEKMAEDGCLWEICKGELENKVAKSENDVKEAIMLSQKHEKLWSQSRQENNEFEKRRYEELANKLKEFNDINKELQNKIIEDGFLFDACKNHEKKCTVLREEKRSLQKKLKECDERIRELNVKFGLSG